MLGYSLLVLAFCSWPSYGIREVRFDYYSASPATRALVKFYKSVNRLANCTIDITLPCNSYEWRRLDGSCNNMHKPSRGTYFNPLKRMLPANFVNVYHPRKALSGKDLTRERIVRQYLLKEGKSISPYFTHLMPALGIFTFADIGSIHDLQNYLTNTTNCCEAAHMDDYSCAPNILEADDPVHRFSGIRCLNMTRPLYHQNYQCTNDSVPSPIAMATQAYDLSQIYNPSNIDIQNLRTFSGGQLTVEIHNGIIWPPNRPSTDCPLNEGTERRCMKYHSNGLHAVVLFSIWYYRHHNYLATKLSEINPSWNDETLFQVARDMNIAISQHIYFNEWLESLIGRENLIKSEVLGNGYGYRDIYDESLFPMVSIEYSHSLRWFHTMQETNGKKYDTEGNIVGNYALVIIAARTGYLGADNNMVEITQGMFRQPTKDFDSTVDFDLAEKGLGNRQWATDFTSDLHKSRLFGLPPYLYYVKKCHGITIRTFDDLICNKFITAKKVALLKEVYEDVRDVDLMAAMWLENKIEGGKIPKTLACIIQDNMLHAVKSDRYWYERPNRPHAYTEDQLAEIRKASLAMLLCNVADGVTKIQPRALLIIGPNNPLTSCDNIPNIDFMAWKIDNNN